MMRSRQKHKPRDSDPSLVVLSEDSLVKNDSKDAVNMKCISWNKFLLLLLGFGVIFLLCHSYASNISNGLIGEFTIETKATKSASKSVPSHKTPTITDDTTDTDKKETKKNQACDGFEGIYHIQSGDVGGAAATIFFQFVIAQLIYAEDHNYKPWVFFNNISHHVYDQEIHNATQSQTTVQFTMMKGMQVTRKSDIRLARAAYPGKPYTEEPLHPHSFSMTGDGVWENYFEAVSDFNPSDKDTSCEAKPLLTMDIWLITPGLHIYADWTPRMWRYDVLPDYMQQRHLPLREWLTPQRLRAHDIAQKYIRVRPHLWEQAEQLLRSNSGSIQEDNDTRNCVGIHIRWSDKGGGRRLIGVDEFLPYVETFLQNGGNCVMVATDSGRVLEHIALKWPMHIRAVLTSQGEHVIRSNDVTPVFEIKGKSDKLVSHHRTNTEVLVDILALSKCKFILHGHSAVSDAAMYLNGDLIYQSVNLEDPDDLSLNEYGAMVKDILIRQVAVNHTKYFPRPWWEQSSTMIGKNVGGEKAADDICDGYNGILRIAIGGGADFSFGMTVFHFVLNQLLYADMQHLKPWVHLEKEEATAVYDDAVHQQNNEVISFEMLSGVNVQEMGTDSKSDSQKGYYPGNIGAPNSTMTKTKVTVAGNGVWSSYFAPVSDFDPSHHAGASSCKKTPLLSLDKAMVFPGLHKLAPWSVKTFKYSGMPDHAWRGKTSSNRTDPTIESPHRAKLADWMYPMRAKAHEIVKKYYKPHPFIWERVQEVNPIDRNEVNKKATCCLAVHIRQGDKEGYGKRKPSRIRNFKPYVEAFLNVMDDMYSNKESPTKSSHIYLATDSWRVVDKISESWAPSLTSRIRSQGDRVVRSVRWVPAHLLEPDNHHRVNLEALVDILAMSKCQFFLHGFSTVAEAAIYMNIDLHTRSVNLDDPGHISVEEFQDLVHTDMNKPVQNA